MHVTLNEGIVSEALEEPWLRPEVPCMQNRTFRSLHEIPRFQTGHQRHSWKIAEMKPYITAPGQWLASSKVIVTSSSLFRTKRVGTWRCVARCMHIPPVNDKQNEINGTTAHQQIP